MAKILSQAGIETSNLVEAWHVTQSIDAFTGVEAYDITLSGSLTVTGDTNITGSFIVSDETYDFMSSTYYLSEKINTNTYQLSVPNTVDASTFPTLDWFSGSLKDQSAFNRNSVNWLSRTLHNTSGVSILNWSSGINITGSTRISGSLSVTGPTSTSGSLSVTGSTNMSGSVFIRSLTTSSQNNIVTIDSTTGQLYYTSSASIIPTPPTINTGSFYRSSSINSNTITFYQGDGTEEYINIPSPTGMTWVNCNTTPFSIPGGNYGINILYEGANVVLDLPSSNYSFGSVIEVFTTGSNTFNISLDCPPGVRIRAFTDVSTSGGSVRSDGGAPYFKLIFDGNSTWNIVSYIDNTTYATGTSLQSNLTFL